MIPKGQQAAKLLETQRASSGPATHLEEAVDIRLTLIPGGYPQGPFALRPQEGMLAGVWLEVL